ncbi:MAG: MFS transporter, partial [Actinomycetota bacterium]
MTAWRHLAHLLRGKWFRRLFAVRVTSQLGDGVFQVALASYVIFSPEQAPSPAAIAGALAVVLLPFSMLGPFVGVFLDRWSRRQVLVWSNAVRVVLVSVIAVGVALELGTVLLVLILAALSVNRFLLAGLSASLPHVVDPPDLIMANAVTPTSGTLASLAGVAVGTTGRVLFEGSGGLDPDVVVLVTAAVIYTVAVLLALRIPRPLLGPTFDPTRPGVREAARHVAR